MESFHSRMANNFFSPISDDDFIIQIIEGIPQKGYGDLITSFVRQMSSVVDPLTLSSIKTQLRAHHRYNKNETRGGRNDEALFGEAQILRDISAKRVVRLGMIRLIAGIVYRTCIQKYSFSTFNRRVSCEP